MNSTNRIKFAPIFEKAYHAFEDNLKTGFLALKLAEQKGRKDLVYVYNINQFCSLFGYDLCVLLDDIELSESEWKKRLYARVLALSIVEFLEDIGQLLGKEYRNKILLLNNQEICIEKLNLIAKDLNNLRTRNEAFLRQVRNAVIAHKEHDTMRQMEIIGELDLEKIKYLSIDFIQWITSFTKFSTGLIKLVGKDLNKK